MEMTTVKLKIVRNTYFLTSRTTDAVMVRIFEVISDVGVLNII